MKHTGIVYTPEYIAKFIVDKVAPLFSKCNSFNVLEPSCGNGVFIPLVNKSFSNIKFNAIEISTEACEGLNKYLSQGLLDSLTNTNFLTYEPDEKFDLIIGNPPYLNRKYLEKEQKHQLDEFSKKIDFLGDKKISNIWSAFILKAESLLSKNGVLAFLLPAEILQVTHAQYIQTFLQDTFERVDILYFNQMIFDNAEQDAVLLIAKKLVKKPEKPGLYISEVSTNKKKITCKRAKKFKSVLPYKWTSHILTNYESSMLSSLLKDFNKLEHYATSSAGIVTAANNYFIVPKDIVEEYSLESYTKPIIKNGAYINGAVSLTSSDWKTLEYNNSPCSLLDFSNQEIHEDALKYLQIGLDQKIEKRYKCLQRKKWFEIPSVWHSEGIFFKRSHFYPKLLHNEDSILVTDSAYRVSMINGYDMKSLIYSFYNSMTLSFVEILGRSYAGGVLELTPNEFRSSPLPYAAISSSDFEAFKKSFSAKQNISDVLEHNNHEILKSTYNMSCKEVSTLETIRLKFLNKRLRS